MSVAPNGEVSVTFGSPFGDGGANTFVAPFGGSPADLPAVIRAVVEGQHAAEQQYYLVLSVLAVGDPVARVRPDRLVRRGAHAAPAAHDVQSRSSDLELEP